MRKIIVSVTNDITNDQRVTKVCNTLQSNGYFVLLIGRKLSNSKPLDLLYETKRFSLLFNKGFLFYAEYNIRLFLFLLFAKFDVLLSNDLDTLAPNFLISKVKKKKLIFDSHELFPEIPELVNRPKTKKIWQWIEKNTIPHLKYCYTVSQSIAEYYKEKYGTHFAVVRNVPRKIDSYEPVELPFNTTGKKIILYQGAINIGRGLELMIDTIEKLENCILLIVGDGDIFEKLTTLTNQKKLNNKVIFLGKVSPEKLKTITPLANVGISIEEDLGLNYRYALPNKLFDYIHAGIPVITSNLPEMRKIILQYKIGEVLEHRTPGHLAKKIESVLSFNYSKHLKKAEKELVWHKEEITLKKIFNSFE